eukprot:GABV01000132.1.p1 GENE.GABV01000132.1~~GABV01000132.1.p1  ORF type:complete len:294 (+),score=85.62 GABV01000132.1:738-1619(+)
MALNRYYVAAGVRIFSQETWVHTVGDQGREFVEKYIDKFVDYYTHQVHADNHAVREAGCACIAELATKISKDAVRPFLPQLLQVLEDAFRDASWPVRQAACVSLGDFVSEFPEESQVRLEGLYTLWFEHLSDNIPSVRADSAHALGKVLRVYGASAKTRILEHIRENLTRVTQQEVESIKYGELENVTTFGVAAKRARDNDPELHQRQTPMSCGSLAPKLRRGGGCMDHGISRHRDPWEFTDGTVHLLKELAAVEPDAASEFFADLAKAAHVRHFGHTHNLQETIWKNGGGYG